MILYKYLSLDTGISALTHSTVRFTPIDELNDPFETEADYTESSGYISKASSFSHGVLSLTRSPVNQLMWSHYAYAEKQFINDKSGSTPDPYMMHVSGKRHGGIVIGIDTEEAGFEKFDENVLPALAGNVIYTKTKPTHIPITHQRDFNFDTLNREHFHAENLENLQRKFLYKSSDWSYEEEVRVVRNISGPTFGAAPYPDLPGNLKYLRGIAIIPRSSIKEIFFGCAFSDSHTALHTPKIAAIFDSYKHCRIFVCKKNDLDWGLTCELKLNYNANDRVLNIS